jgi:4-amino-4-deoxychorismate lyase
MQIALLNGCFVDPDQPAIYLQNRGWQYGDGLFETMLLIRGRVRFLSDHVERLRAGCTRLGLQMPDRDLLHQELQMLCSGRQDAMVKLTLMRSGSERGYRPPPTAQTIRLWQVFDAPVPAPIGITVRWCDMRLSRNAQLADVKHCNRLEQVLAQAEWCDADIVEGLMLDTEGELICGTMSNVFLVLEGVLVTPDLRYSGIAGVMRKNVLRLAAKLQVEAEQRAVRAEEVLNAQELFICNAVRGIQPVIGLEGQHWSIGKLAMDLHLAVQGC